LPGSRYRILWILPQYVERPHQVGAQARQLETAAGELHAVTPRDDACGVDLETGDSEIGPDGAQSTGQLEGRVRHRPVPEVDDEGIRRVEQNASNIGVVHQPPVAATQPIDAGGAAGDDAFRSRARGTTPVRRVQG
jgi:hypothetical protein